MLRRSLLTALVFGYLSAQAAPSTAAKIFAQLFPLTGEVRLLNRGVTAVPIVFYQITSAANALDGSDGVWKSITKTYDSPTGPTPGNGLVDPVGEWQIVAAASSELTEAAFLDSIGILRPTRAISLGSIWDPAAVGIPDLVFDIRSDQSPIPVTIEFAVDGDYSSNQVVDAADYVLWRKHLNSTTVLLADGNLNGVVDQADYQTWQRNFGRVAPTPPFGTGSGGLSGALSASAGIVPEPTTQALLLIALGGLGAFRRRVPRVFPQRGHGRNAYCTRSSTAR